MQENIKDNIVDFRDLRWGNYPVPLLPKSLRLIWGKELLPSWLCEDLGISQKSALSCLDTNSLSHIGEMNARTKNYLRFLVRTRSDEIKNIRCWQNNLWPINFNLDDIFIDQRLKNELHLSSLDRDSNKLLNLTYGNLSSMPSIGPIAILNLVSIVDYVLDYFTEIDGSINDIVEDLNLKSLLNEDWISQVYPQDSRFPVADLIPRDVSLKDFLDDLIDDPSSLDVLKIQPKVKEMIAQVTKVKSEIDQQTLEQVLSEMLKLNRISDQKRLSAISERFGWSGGKPKTLEECGKILNVTRERIRQIQNSFLKKVPDQEIYFPQIDSALELLEENAPIESTKASQLLKDAGITHIDFNIHGILQAAEVFKRKTNLNIVQADDTELIITSPETKLYELLKRSAKKLSRKSGVSNIYQLIGTLNNIDVVIPEEDCRKILTQISEILFLDDIWFWFSNDNDRRNRLYNVTRKILSVTMPQSIPEIREGLKRTYKFRNSSGMCDNLIVPPSFILMKYFDKHPSFEIENDLVKYKEPLDYKQELGTSESAFVDVIRTTPSGLIDRETLAKLCHAKGVSEAFFGILTSYSPILDHVDMNIWKLRGTNIEPATLEAIRKSKSSTSREKRSIDYGWNDDGTLWLAAKVPYNRETFVLLVPSAVGRFVAGLEFNVFSKEDNLECGIIKLDDKGLSWGYYTYIKKYGLDSGDILVIEFNLEKKIVFLSRDYEDYLQD